MVEGVVVGGDIVKVGDTAVPTTMTMWMRRRVAATEATPTTPRTEKGTGTEKESRRCPSRNDYVARTVGAVIFPSYLTPLETARETTP